MDAAEAPAASSGSSAAASARRALLIAITAQSVTVFNRTSLAVAAQAASARFGVPVAFVAAFAAAQLVVYAAMQNVVGRLIDRWGHRAVLVAGLSAMAVGQVALAQAHGPVVAIAARSLLGAGDAGIFISVVRLLHTSLSPRRFTGGLLTASVAGQVGNVVASVPLVVALREVGWTPAFTAAGLAAGLVALLVRRALPVGPGRQQTTPARKASPWRSAGVRLGFWVHFSAQFSSLSFLVLWGVPFLLATQRVSHEAAGGLLALQSGSYVVGGLGIGRLSVARPRWRLGIALGVVAATAITWAVVLAWSGPSPRPLIVALMVVMGLGQPASTLAFDVARRAVPTAALGRASALVNTGGFCASALMVAGVGLVVGTLEGHGSMTAADAYRWAFCVQFPVWALGLTGVARSLRRLRER